MTKDSKLRFQTLDFFMSGLVILFLLIIVAVVSASFSSLKGWGALAVILFVLRIALYSICLLIVDTVVFSLFRFWAKKKRGQRLSP